MLPSADDATAPQPPVPADVRAVLHENVDKYRLQKAYVEEQVPQCGYCINGWIMTAASLLNKNPKATDAQLRDGLAGLKCRCGTHVSILRAIKRAQQAMA